MMEPKDKNSPEGLWAACEEMELLAREVIIRQLKPFDRVIKTCYEAGVQAPTLPSKRHHEPDLTYAALFLNKALNDLRSVWILLRIGYTSQAASVAASLFENALAVSCLAGKPSNVKKLEKNKRGDLPWKPHELSKELAAQWREEERILGRKFDQEDYDLAWREVYAGYKWLCKIKHPTMGSAIHDAAVTSHEPDEFVVMAVPDFRHEDITVKVTILSIAINRVREALRTFVLAGECDTTTQDYQSFLKRMQIIHNGTVQAYKETAKEPLTFVVNDQSIQSDYRRLKIKSD